MEHGWNEKLASDSEAAVRLPGCWLQLPLALCCKADRLSTRRMQVKSDRHVDHDTPIEELQEHTVKHIRREHHAEEDVVVEKKAP